MNQSMIDRNDGLMAGIGMFSLSALSMNARSLTMIASIIDFEILMFSPSLLSDPYLYSVDFEDILNYGESRNTVFTSMKKLS